MGKQSIQEQIDELGDLFGEMLSDQEMFKLDEAKRERTNKLMISIKEQVVSFPGRLIYEENPKKLKKNQAGIDLLWKTIDEDEIFDEIISGGYAGLLAHSMGDYAARAKKLKPTFISVNPIDKDFPVFFEEAMNCWLYGSNRASIILCFSILEDLLKEKLLEIDDQLVYKLSSSDKLNKVRVYPSYILIKNAYKKFLITKDQKDSLFIIKNKRNDIVHNLHSVNSSETYEMIIQTKEIVEHLLSGK